MKQALIVIVSVIAGIMIHKTFGESLDVHFSRLEAAASAAWEAY